MPRTAEFKLCLPCSPMLGWQLTSAAYTVDILQHLTLIQPFGGRKISLLSRTDPTHGSKTSKEEPKAQQQMYVIHGKLIAVMRKHKGLPSHSECWKNVEKMSSCILSLLVWYLGQTYSDSRQKVLALNGHPVKVFSRPDFSLHWCLLLSFYYLWGKLTFLYGTTANSNPKYLLTWVNPVHALLHSSTSCRYITFDQDLNN